MEPAILIPVKVDKEILLAMKGFWRKWVIKRKYRDRKEDITIDMFYFRKSLFGMLPRTPSFLPTYRDPKVIEEGKTKKSKKKFKELIEEVRV